MRWSIIVCTHNRASDLQRALPELDALDYASDQFEVVVVDNASDDNTADVVHRAQAETDRLSYAREDRVGLSHARNRGISTARGEFIAFIDDDARPERDWLKELDKVFMEPRVACAGGMVRPSWRHSSGWPGWLHQRLIGFYSVIEYGEDRELHYPNYPVGTNIAFRRRIFDEVGGFNAALGRTGDRLLSGEETDLCLRIERAGYTVRYTPLAVVHHYVHGERLNKEWLIRRSYWQGASVAAIEREYFSEAKIVSRTVKYLVFIAAGGLGKFLFSLIRNERMSLFCACQVELCKAYIAKTWGRT